MQDFENVFETFVTQFVLRMTMFFSIARYLAMHIYHPAERDSSVKIEDVAVDYEGSRKGTLDVVYEDGDEEEIATLELLMGLEPDYRI